MNEFYDPKKDAEEKQRARERDGQSIADGSATREEISKRNGKFAFPRVRIEFDKAKALS